MSRIIKSIVINNKIKKQFSYDIFEDEIPINEELFCIREGVPLEAYSDFIYIHPLLRMTDIKGEISNISWFKNIKTGFKIFREYNTYMNALWRCILK